MTYLKLLKHSAERAGHVVCLGLDPVVEALPGERGGAGTHGGDAPDRLRAYFGTLLEALLARNLHPAAFKPNIGFYSALDRPPVFGGSALLWWLIGAVRSAYPDVPIILDAKRGDIARSSANYAAEAFSVWRVDAVTVAPYMGADSVSPFSTVGPAYVLLRTSNPGGADLQNIPDGMGRPLYKTVLERLSAWAEAAPEPGRIGAVAGATNPAELEEIARAAGRSRTHADGSRTHADGTGAVDAGGSTPAGGAALSAGGAAPSAGGAALSAGGAAPLLPLLIPGVGGQGGSATEVVRRLTSGGYPIWAARINSSSGLTHPWHKNGGTAPSNWPETCADAFSRLADEARL